MLLSWWCNFKIQYKELAGLQFSIKDCFSLVLTPVRMRWTIPLVTISRLEGEGYGECTVEYSDFPLDQLLWPEIWKMALLRGEIISSENRSHWVFKNWEFYASFKTKNGLSQILPWKIVFLNFIFFWGKEVLFATMRTGVPRINTCLGSRRVVYF
jgi:hypothetical protein